jgi:hypothetical protein
MEFPNELQQMIRAYAKPITRPDWRRLHKMTLHCYYIQLVMSKNTKNKHVLNPVLRIIRECIII